MLAFTKLTQASLARKEDGEKFLVFKSDSFSGLIRKQEAFAGFKLYPNSFIDVYFEFFGASYR